MATSTRTVGGETFRAGPRTWAHIDATIAKLKTKHPTARFRVIQGSYNTTIPASAGTHDRDAVIDVAIDGLSWRDAQAFLRWTGWAAWHRTPAQGFMDHIHMVSIPPGLPDNSPTLTQVQTAFAAAGIPVGAYVPAQVYDYYRHAYGLKGGHDPGSDGSPFPPDINATVFKAAAPTVKVPLPTITDCTVALERFRLASNHAPAKFAYLSAAKAIGPLADGRRVRVPTSVSGVIDVLEKRRDLATAAVPKARLSLAIALLKPLK